MKVTGIRLHLVECRLPEPQGAGGHFFDRRSALLVEVLSTCPSLAASPK
jgi:hypothetical protein